MKAFTFRLEGLLRVRKVEEDRQVATLRQQQKQTLDLEARLESIQVAQRTSQEKLRAVAKGTLDMNEVLMLRRHLNQLAKEKMTVRADVRQRREAVRVAQRAVVAAVRNRQVVERLKQRQYEEYRGVLKKVEERELEELRRPGARTRDEFLEEMAAS